MNPTLLASISNIGLIIFALLYFYASTLYDGGSKLDPHRKSWDWINNYWCDLIWPTTLLEEPNKASKWGIVANSILCFSMILFFLAFSFVLVPDNYWRYVVSISGTIAMICGMLIFSKFHDQIIGVMILSAIPALTGLIYGLIHFNQRTALFWGGISLFSIAINIYIFYTKKGEHWLPFIQKIAFVIVLGWVFFMNSTI
ncbi:MAG: hypothetical protein P1U70_20760 [Saprospiraceae bacterium]|jgi:hypothetical protein|nr:hypothetical protein [Saprospiraceae bacterium]